MKKRLRYVFFMAAVTAACILVFQAYWVYNSYLTGERNLHARVLNALQKSIDEYPLLHNKIPMTLNNQPSLAMMRSFSKAPKKSGLYNVTFQSLSVSPANVQLVQQMVALLMTQMKDSPIELNVIDSLFKTELNKNNIGLSFKLVLLKSQKKLIEGHIAAFVNFSKENVVIEAVPERANIYLLRQNIAPALVSVALVLLSAGSLFFMGTIIHRQIRLDEIKNDFIGNITHELRTPIAILKSSHEALHKFGESADPLKTDRYLRINSKILEKLEHNVDRILDITNYEHGVIAVNLVAIDVDLLINSIVDRFQLAEAANISYIPGMKSPEQPTDPYMIDTIISNLVDNALKYNEPRTKVEISTRSLRHGWELQIADCGKGIDQAYLPFIFDKFYRVPSGDLHDVKGYGLGLSYVRQLTEALNGSFEVKSKPGEGLNITFKFPGNG